MRMCKHVLSRFFKRLIPNWLFSDFDSVSPKQKVFAIGDGICLRLTLGTGLIKEKNVLRIMGGKSWLQAKENM